MIAFVLFVVFAVAGIVSLGFGYKSNTGDEVHATGWDVAAMVLFFVSAGCFIAGGMA